jgi:hypothetical protein
MVRRVIRVIDSTLRLPSLKAGVCSGLTLSGVFLPRLQRQGLAPSNGSSSPLPYLLFRSITFDRLHGSLRKGPHHTHVVLPRLPVVGSYRLLEVGIQH